MKNINLDSSGKIYDFSFSPFACKFIKKIVVGKTRMTKLGLLNGKFLADWPIKLFNCI